MNKRRNICILGITGSVGTQTVAIAKKLGYNIVACSFHSNVKLAQKIIKENNIKYFYCTNNYKFSNSYDYRTLFRRSKTDLVVNAIVGFAGLQPTIIALQNKFDIALANKESTVVAGWYIFSYAKKHNVKVLPIDSEHSNLFYQLMHAKDKDVNQVYITCSGGKYFNSTKAQKAKVTYEQATDHKNWLMGNKITIDSNTLMNKCFEVVEAYWYFNTDKINVLLDPTSIIHSAILMNDGEFYIANSSPSMAMPITWALTDYQYPMKKTLVQEPKTMVLSKINDVKPISLAYDIIHDETHSLGIIANAANEVAIRMFEAGMIKFSQINDYVENAMKKIKKRSIKTIDDIYDFDIQCRLQSIKYWK